MARALSQECGTNLIWGNREKAKKNRRKWACNSYLVVAKVLVKVSNISRMCLLGRYVQ
jgi:hypothetical protein